MSLKIIMLMAVSGIAVIGSAHAKEDGALNGRVTDHTGEPIHGANVVVHGPSLTAPMGTYSVGDGAFAIGAIPPGIYQVEVTHIGYRTALRREVLIEAGGSRDIDFTLVSTVIYLDQNVVSASRIQQKAIDAPASVAVVEAPEIRDNPVLTVSDHVKDLAGIDFAQTGLATTNVVARGFNNVFSGTLLILTDNRIARVPSLRINASNFIPVTNDDIERIEVVLGPGSALYGPNSANGVMHVITRSPFVSSGTDVSIGFGERSLRKGSIRHAGTLTPNLGYKVSAQSYVGTDWKLTDPVEEAARSKEAANVIDPAQRKLKARDFGLGRQSVEARVDYRLAKEANATLSYGHNKGDHIELTGIGAAQVLDWTYNYVQARFTYDDLFAQYFHNWSDAGDTFLLANGDQIVDKSSLDVFQIRHSTRLGVRERLTYGVDALLTRPATDGTINGQNEDDDGINEFGVYVQSETDLTEQFDLVLAMRLDDHNRVDGSVLSPRAALLYKPRESQTLRLTYNRAFSTPSTNNLFLDRVAQRDPYGMAQFGVGPINVTAQGTYREDNVGMTFVRDDETGLPKFRSPFHALAGLSADAYIDMHDPNFTNVMWGVGRGAVLQQADQFVGLLMLQGMDETTAQGTIDQLTQILPAVIPESLNDLRNTTLKLNLEKAQAGDPNPFDPVALTDVVDVRLTEPTITRTLEVGYKGIANGNIVLSVDMYRTETEDFSGLLAVETPNVFLDPSSITESLGPVVEAAVNDNPALADGLQALDGLSAPGLIGGEANDSGADELTSAFALGAARIPFGTVSPFQAYDPHAVILTYRNFGDVTVYGIDLSAGYYPNDIWNVTGSYSYVDDNFFANLGGIADVALNAPKHKFRIGGQYRMPAHNLRLGGRMRHNGSFQMKSGVYEGKVQSYSVFDLNATYDLPYGENLSLILNVDNVLNKEFRAFVGAPDVGRLVYAELGVSF